MTIQEFNNISLEKKVFYLYFYSPSCFTCKNITPQLSIIKNPIYPIEGDKFEEISNLFNIEYYPSLVKIENKTPTIYSGSKSIKNLIKKLES